MKRTLAEEVRERSGLYDDCCVQVPREPERDMTLVCRCCGREDRPCPFLSMVPRYRWLMSQRWLDGLEG